jgi:hypothetical protein
VHVGPPHRNVEGRAQACGGHGRFVARELRERLTARLQRSALLSMALERLPVTVACVPSVRRRNDASLFESVRSLLVRVICLHPQVTDQGDDEDQAHEPSA